MNSSRSQLFATEQIQDDPSNTLGCPESLDNRPNVLDEIWSEIFTYLSADDLANIRLTCRHFYRLCDETRVQGNEVLMFGGGRGGTISSGLQLMSRSRRTFRNIVFNRAIIGHENSDAILEFFQQHGANIHSLNFHECYFQAGLFAGLLEHCTALRSLRVALKLSSTGIGDATFARIERVLEDIRGLTANSTTFDQVEELTFKVILYSASLGADGGWQRMSTTNRSILQLFALFPNARRVYLKIIVAKSFIPLPPMSTEMQSEIQSTVSSIYDRILALEGQLETLRLHFNFGQSQSDLTPETVQTIRRIQNMDLKELALNWIDSSHTFATNPFLVFQHVTRFHYEFKGYRSISASAAMHLLLNAIPGLRFLTFLTDIHFHMSKECFTSVVTSKLTKLKIQRARPEYDIKADFEASSIAGTVHPNYLLRHLWIDEKWDQNLISLFATYFRGLQHITFLKVDERTLHILKQLGNLRSVKLCNGIRDDSIDHNVYQQYLQNDDPLQYHLLGNVTHLDIVELKSSLTNFVLGKFLLPKVESLSIEINEIEEQGIDQLWSVLSKIARLKLLRLKFGLGVRISFQRLQVLVQSLPKLRHLYFNEHRKAFLISECYHLFDNNPSLRTYNHCYQSRYVYDSNNFNSVTF